MKKIISSLLALIMVVTILPAGIFNISAKAATSGYYTYEVVDGKATITQVGTGSGLMSSLLPFLFCLLIGLGIFFYVKKKKSKIGANPVKAKQVDKNNPGYKLDLTAKILMVISILGSVAWMICGIVMLNTAYWDGVHSFGIYWESESHLRSTGLTNLILGLVCGIAGVILSNLLSQFAKGKTKEFESNTLLIKTLKDTSNKVPQDSMEKLNAWLKQGYITEEEYQKKKEEILNKL